MVEDLIQYYTIVLFGVVILFLLYLVYIMERKMSAMSEEFNELSGAIDKTYLGLEELNRHVETSIKISLSQHVRTELDDVQKKV